VDPTAAWCDRRSCASWWPCCSERRARRPAATEIRLIDAQATQLDLDITVGPAGVGVFTNEDANRFPQAGQTTVWGRHMDTISCLKELSIEAGGARLPLSTDVTGMTDAVLVLSGCGGQARIPISGVQAPGPALTATPDAYTRAVTVTWDSSPEASTAIIILWTPLWGELHHVVDHQLTSSPSLDGIRWDSVSVWAFAPMTFLETEYGIARVWTGDRIDVALP
jgi:hypothetical protein